MRDLPADAFATAAKRLSVSEERYQILYEEFCSTFRAGQRVFILKITNGQRFLFVPYILFPITIGLGMLLSWRISEKIRCKSGRRGDRTG
ncbi:MAG: hypothetical protein B6D35_11855 [Candidatus Brocadia sp. UTAMX2]|nr:MAG: hypothetical protein B6D35_11855 [Candidatus Brocadia sp. UTAMX2]